MKTSGIIYDKRSDETDHLYFEHSYGGKCYTHFHLATEVVGVIQGQIEVFINGDSRVLTAGEIAVIPSYHVHDFLCAPGNEDFVLTISQSTLQKFLSIHSATFENFLPRGPYTDRIFAWFRTIEENWENSDFLMHYGLINFLFGLLAKAYPPARRIDPKAVSAAPILQYIEDHLTESLTLEGLAAAFGYSKNYFSAMFNRVTGMHLKDYVNRLRLQRAKARLDSKNRSETVLEIASDCGFNSLNTFYRALRRHEQS